MIKIVIPFITWLIGAYIVLFASCLYLHVNASNVISNRVEALLPKITRDGKSRLVEVAAVQNMKTRLKPRFWEPHTLFNSLFGEHQTHKSINRTLGRAIEKLKDDLNGINFGPVDLREANLDLAKLQFVDFTKANLSQASLKGAKLGFANLKESVLVNADLSKTDLHETDISNANLQGTVLNQTNFIRAKLDSANLIKVNFNKTNLYGADLNGAILKGANLSTAVNVTCKQIKSAVIDANTRLPDYINMAESSSSNFQPALLMGLTPNTHFPSMTTSVTLSHFMGLQR